MLARGYRFLEEEFPPRQSLAIDFAKRASKRENPEGKIRLRLAVTMAGDKSLFAGKIRK